MDEPSSIIAAGAAAPQSDLPGATVRIRPFPYPYKAALAICNDLDGIRTLAEMKAIHDVLNGRKMTPCGPGLGLEIGDSLHFFSVHPEQDDTPAYFDGLTNKPTPDAPALREGISSGLFDIIHTWGNYSQKGGFFREQALWAAEELEKYSLRIPVWVNHGDRHNFQNLGRTDSLGDVQAHFSRRGDRSEVLEYHADVARRIGIRYVWIKELTPLSGQERKLDWRDWLEQGSDLGRILARGLIGRDNRLIPGQPIQWANELLRLGKLRDGGSFYEILRYGDFRLDGSDHLPQLLSLRFLRRLVEVEGACLLYMHLGKGRPSPELPFSKESYQALERLAQWAQAGDIWVTTASRLCRYIELRRRLQLSAQTQGQETWVQGQFRAADDLLAPTIEGVTFYLSASSCKATIPGQAEAVIPIKNPADHTGLESFTIPMAPLEYCWE
jgi:hypothetical protein